MMPHPRHWGVFPCLNHYTLLCSWGVFSYTLGCMRFLEYMGFVLAVFPLKYGFIIVQICMCMESRVRNFCSVYIVIVTPTHGVNAKFALRSVTYSTITYSNWNMEPSLKLYVLLATFILYLCSGCIEGMIIIVLKCIPTQYMKSCACNMHVTSSYMHIYPNMPVT